MVIDENSSFQKILEEYGYDWSDVNIDWSELNLNKLDLSRVTLPKDRDFFQKTRGKTLCHTVLPEGDYSRYDFNNVVLYETIFTKYSKLPKSKNFFKIIHEYIGSIVLPKGDYRQYDLGGGNLANAIFTYDSVMPEYTDFLQDIQGGKESWLKIGYERENFRLTQNMIRNIHNYNLKEIAKVDLTCNSDLLSNEQISIIRIKYKDLIGKNIFLPEKGLFKENNRILDENKSIII